MSSTLNNTGAPQPWCLYLLECTSGAYYAGITNDLEKRFAAHQSGKGAKYTRANKPLRILRAVWFPDRIAAAKAEWALKQIPRAKKMAALAAMGAEHAGLNPSGVPEFP